MQLTNYSLTAILALFLLPLATVSGQVSAVTGLSARAYDHHVELRWDTPPNPTISSIRIYGSTDGGENFTALGSRPVNKTNYIDFVGEWDATTHYYLRAVGAGGAQGLRSDTVSATTFEMSDSMLLDMVQEYTLRYFYDFGHPVSGLARERNTTSTVTSGGSGFGIMALIVGAERGFLTYEQARERTSKIVDFLGTVPRFRGAFSHWMNGATGAVIPFSPQDDGGDLVETAFLIQGLLTARQYYTGDSAEEIALRENITRLWEEVNWNWYRRGTRDVLTWHWSPTNQFAIDLNIRGFNESQIIYILGIAAPDDGFDIPASLYHTGWAGGNYETAASFYGIPLEVGRGKGGPLFFSHYSYLGFDPRGISDRYTNYFRRNTAQSRINYEHCVDNPYNRAGYGPGCWGLTASDDPDGYLAHGPNNPQEDNGTITPTAALSSFPYTPVESMAALKHFYREMGDRTWGEYGFYDAFNEGRNWYANSYLAIDQGPIVCMIENHRSGLLWDLFMQNPEIGPALEEIGFTRDTTTAVAELPGIFSKRPTISPNPGNGENLTLDLALNRPVDQLSIRLLDGNGRLIQELHRERGAATGSRSLVLHLRPRPVSGTYYLHIQTSLGATSLPLVLHP